VKRSALPRHAPGVADRQDTRISGYMLEASLEAGFAAREGRDADGALADPRDPI